MSDSQRFRTVFDYPQEYLGPRPLAEQISEIAWRFGLCAKMALAYIERGLPKKLPRGAESRFAIPTVAGLAARFFPEVQDPSERYRRAVTHALRVLGVAQEFDSPQAEKKIIPGLNRSERSARYLEMVSREQPGDILIIAAQLGRRHRGLAAKDVPYVDHEFGLGTLEAVAILLTHPQRFIRLEELDLDCPGDVCLRPQDGKPLNVPFLSHTGSGILYGTNWHGSACDRTAQATGFLPGPTDPAL
jgi:hypothetical protein